MSALVSHAREDTTRRCACNCGASMAGQPERKLYVDDRHRQRAYRTRVGDAAAAVGVSTSLSFRQLNLTEGASVRNGDAQARRQLGQKRSRSGLQMSYRKTVAILAAELEERRLVKPAGQGAVVAEMLLRRALPRLQLARLDARAYAREEDHRAAA